MTRCTWIYRQTHEQTPNTITKTLNTGKPETPYQTLHDNERYTANTQTKTLTQEEKMNVDIIKKESCLKRKPHRLLLRTKTGESQVRNQESERLIDKYPDKLHHGVKRFNICWRKINLWKNRGPTEDHRQKVKIRMGTQIRITDKKLRQAKIPKRNIKIYSDEIEKERLVEWKTKHEEIKQNWRKKEG